MPHIDWLWIFGGVGATGLIALAIFAPAVLALAGQGLMAIARTRLGLAVLALGLGLALGDVYGTTLGAADCRAGQIARDAAAREAALKRQLDNQEKAARAAGDQAALLASQKEATDEKLARYRGQIDRLAAAIRDGRRATADDDRVLCDVLGDAPAGCAQGAR